MAESMVISRIPTTKKVMALTFDDGSDAANLIKELNILASHDIRCTFFLTGKATEAHPSLIKEILRQGHEIGNHSYSHPYFTSMTASAMTTELLKAEYIITSITGVNPKPLFRPPYGAYNSTVLLAAGNTGYTKTLMWSIDTIDWNGTPAGTMINKVLNGAQPGSVVLMHTGGGTHTPEALPEIISGLKQKGYTLTTVSKMLTEAAPDKPILRIGNSGSFVKELQQKITKLGYQPGPIDGIFGRLTEAAVKAFQTSTSLTVDGIVGPKTWMALDDFLQNPAPVIRPTTRKGSTGEAVVYLQQVLSQLGFDPGPVDGIFGTRTEDALKGFQRANSLAADGIAGPKTWAALGSIMG